MKKLFFTTAVIIAITTMTNAQTCLKLKEGQQLTSVTSSWVNTLQFDKKFVNAGDAGRDKMVLDYNQQIESGKVKGFGGVPTTFKVTDWKQSGNRESVSMAVGPYKFPIVCDNDTVLLYRNTGIMWTIEKGDTIAASFQGASVFPNNLQVGDRLPLYEDFITTFPKSWNQKVKRSVIDGYKKSTSSFFGYGVDSKTGVSGVGSWKKTEHKAVYKTIESDLQVSIESSSIIRYHIYATVTGTEELKIGKNTYTAFVVESEKWVKTQAGIKWESEDMELVAMLEKNKAHFDAKLEKKQTRKGLVNEGGYTVDHVTEWFVPGMGILKMESFDIHGVMTAKTETTAI